MARPKVKKIVVDSSVIVKWLNSQGEDDLPQADRLLDDWEKGKLEIIAPELATYEVANALLYKGLSRPAFLASLEAFFSLPLTCMSQTGELAKEAGRLAMASGITFYDATFLALAASQNATLVTANPKHQNSRMSVHVVSLHTYSLKGIIS